MVPESEKLEKGKPGARKDVAASWEAGTSPCQSRLACLLRWLASYVCTYVTGWLAGWHQAYIEQTEAGQSLDRMCVYVCMCVCMYVHTDVCMYVSMNVSQSPMCVCM